MEVISPDRRCGTRHRLGSRAEALALHTFVGKYVGDALWALMMFLGLGLLLPTPRTVTLAFLAFVVCCTIEFSQLYHAPWIDAARGTWLGRLALGDTFAWGDIAAYLVGIVSGGVMEWAACRARNRNRAEPGAPADGPRE